MRSRVVVSVGIALVVAAAALSVASEPEKVGAVEMVPHQLVLLYRAAEIGGAEGERLQAAHLEHLKRLWEERTALVLGPLARGSDLRGLVLLDVPTVEAAREIVDRDPWVGAGGLRAEIHPWWVPQGLFRKGPEFLDLQSCFLGLLKRPAGAPELSEPELAKIQAGHMENIGRMVDSGDLIVAGPIGDDGTLRGLFVFRTPDEKQVRALVARDPAIAGGRLEMELYTWYVPKGSYPEP